MGLNPDGGATTTATATPEGSQLATVAAGCFWGVEHLFRKQFGPAGKGLVDAKVGYIGGDLKDASYRNVCSGKTGRKLLSLFPSLGVLARSDHSADAEALQVVFNPEQVSYRQLLEFFYKMHDPTTKNRQGGDTGTQYRSAIFYHDAAQEKIAKEVTDKVQKEWWRAGTISTEIARACRPCFVRMHADHPSKLPENGMTPRRTISYISTRCQEATNVPHSEPPRLCCVDCLLMSVQLYPELSASVAVKMVGKRCDEALNDVIHACFSRVKCSVILPL